MVGAAPVDALARTRAANTATPLIKPRLRTYDWLRQFFRAGCAGPIGLLPPDPRAAQPAAPWYGTHRAPALPTVVQLYSATS